MAVANLCAAEPLLIARLREVIGGSISAAQRDAGAEGFVVDSGSVLANAADVARYCPAAFVLPGPGEPGDGDETGSVQAELQQWSITVCVAHYRDPDGLSTTAQSAGGYLAEVIQAIVGWQPDPTFAPFKYVERPTPYYEPGYAEFAVIFATLQVLEGAP